MYTTSEVGRAGEHAVVQWLRSNRCTVTNWNTQAAGSTDIEAVGAARLLIQVKSAVYPSQPASLSSDEEGNIKSRATRTSAEAWEARVLLDQRLQLQSEIAWRKLN